jgi:competence protein ComEA
MSSPPPFVLPPGGPGTRVRALLAGAGRQRVAVALLVLVALVGAGALWVRAVPRLAGGDGQGAPADQTLPRAAPESGVAPDRSASGAVSGASAAAGPAGQVAVHVAGRVRRPGLVRLPAGSRVQDAIRAAGGATSGADLDAVNLARKLTDGEQIRVLAPGDPAPPPSPSAAGPGAPGGPAGPGGVPSAPLDLNTATVEQLDTLPGVGEVTAGRIVAYRTAHPFTTVDELLEVPGIGQRRYDQLKDLVTVA